jgi:hypothetical protein
MLSNLPKILKLQFKRLIGQNFLRVFASGSLGMRVIMARLSLLRFNSPFSNNLINS